MTDHAVTMMPIPAGPSARGTTSVQSSVIDHVTTCPPAIAPMLRADARAAVAVAGACPRVASVVPTARAYSNSGNGVSRT